MEALSQPSTFTANKVAVGENQEEIPPESHERYWIQSRKTLLEIVYTFYDVAQNSSTGTTVP